MPVFTDQTGRKVEIPRRPQRIISAVPSQTELLYDLGLEKEVAGITAYCVQPEHWLREKTVIGGTKDLQIEKIRALQPDLIIGNKEENVKEQIEELEKFCPVWLSDIVSFRDALDMISAVGTICSRKREAEKMLVEMERQRKILPGVRDIPVLYFIWKDPYMVAGNHTFINSFLKEAGFENLAEQVEGRYPVIDPETWQGAPPRLVLLSSEPYAFTTGDAHVIAKHWPGTLVKVIDGKLFSWYGSQILLTIKKLYYLFSELELVFYEKNQYI